jgi:hypothetical protein
MMPLPAGDEPEIGATSTSSGGEEAAEAVAASAEAAAEAAEEGVAATLSEQEQARRADRMPPEYALWFMRNMCPVDGCGGGDRTRDISYSFRVI